MKKPPDKDSLKERAVVTLARLRRQWRAEASCILKNLDEGDNTDDAFSAVPIMAILNSVSLEIAMLEERVEMLEVYVESQVERDKGMMQ